MTDFRKPVKTKFRWIALPLVAALCIAGASRSLSSMDSPGMGVAEDLFLGRLQGALTAFSEIPIRTQTTGQTVFFDSTDLPTTAGNLAFAGHITLDPTGQAFSGVLERFSISGGRIKLDLKQQARIRYRVHRVTFSGDILADAKSALDGLSREMVDQPYTRRLDLVVKARAGEIFGNLGYPEAAIDVHNQLSAGPGPVDLDVDIVKGPPHGPVVPRHEP